MKYFIILLAMTVLSSCNYDVAFIDTKQTEKAMQKALEKAYFEGQKDALNGDVKIKLNKDSCFIWVKSPWDSGVTPIYTPTYLDSQAN